MQARSYLFFGTEDGLRSLVLPIIISLLCHLIVFALILYSPGYQSGRKMPLRVIDVGLVSLSQIQSAPGQGGPAAGKAAGPPAAETAPPVKTVPPVKAAPPAKETVADSKPAEAVSPAPKTWTQKTSLKEETFKPAEVVKQAIKQIEEQAEESRPSTVASAIERIRGKVAEKETDYRPFGGGQTAATVEVGSGPAGSGPGGSGPGGSGPGGSPAGLGGGYGKPVPEIIVYGQKIQNLIRNNWVYPSQLAGQRKDLEAKLVIRIMANGEIKDVRFEKKSGNSFLDDSAYKAVLKSNPLPALPKGYQFYTVMLGFNPEGLQ